MLPKRRVAIPSEVDFRRASGGVRWGRWLVAMLLVTGGVGAYRQNLLAFPPVAKPTSTTPSKPELRTVSLDSLPVLTPEAAAPAPADPALRLKSVVRQTQPISKRVKASPKAEHLEPVAKTEKPKPAPTPAHENPLKAAIRQAIAADSAKK